MSGNKQVDNQDVDDETGFPIEVPREGGAAAAAAAPGAVAPAAGAAVPPSPAVAASGDSAAAVGKGGVVLKAPDKGSAAVVGAHAAAATTASGANPAAKQSKEGQQVERANKKIKMCEPDLKIIVRETDEAGNVRCEKEYMVYSVVYARYSKFIDTTLTVEMKEKARKEIILPVSFSKFEEAMTYLEDPVAVRHMQITDALELVEFYDKYEFAGGLQICDDVFADYIAKHREVEERITKQEILDLLVTAIATAFKFQLSKANIQGSKFIKENLLHNPSSYVSLMLSVEQLKQLHPILIQNEQKFMKDDLGLTQEELESPLFAKFFQEREANRTTRETFKYLSVEGTLTSIDGTYSCLADPNRYEPQNPITYWNNRQAFVYIRQEQRLCDGDWAILAQYQGAMLQAAAAGRAPNQEEESLDDAAVRTRRVERIVLWKCPYSRHRPFPPSDPWIAIDDTAKRDCRRGQVSVKTIMRKAVNYL